MAVKTVTLTLNGQTYDLTLNSSTGKYEATISAPTTTSWGETDHVYAGVVKATDTAGNEATATKADFSALGLRVLEKVAPEISVSYPSAGAHITSGSPEIEWTVTDAGSGIDTGTIKITVDGSAVTSGFTTEAVEGGYKVTYTPGTALADGEHTLLFDVSDNDGNAATQASVAFTVDTVPPVLNITLPEDELITNSRSVAFSGTTNDAHSGPVTLTYAINGGAAQSIAVGEDGAFSGTITLPETDGDYSIVFTATDTTGQSSTVTRSVTLDTAPPVITAVTLTPNPVDAGATYIISVTVTD